MPDDLFMKVGEPLLAINGEVFVVACAIAISLLVTVILFRQAHHRYAPGDVFGPVHPQAIAGLVMTLVVGAVGVLHPHSQVSRDDLLDVGLPLLAFLVAIGTCSAWANIRLSRRET